MDNLIPSIYSSYQQPASVGGTTVEMARTNGNYGKLKTARVLFGEESSSSSGNSLNVKVSSNASSSGNSLDVNFGSNESSSGNSLDVNVDSNESLSSPVPIVNSPSEFLNNTLMCVRGFVHNESSGTSVNKTNAIQPFSSSSISALVGNTQGVYHEAALNTESPQSRERRHSQGQHPENRKFTEPRILKRSSLIRVRKYSSTTPSTSVAVSMESQTHMIHHKDSRSSTPLMPLVATSPSGSAIHVQNGQTHTPSASYEMINSQQVMNPNGSQPLSPSMINEKTNPQQVMNQQGSQPLSMSMINALQVHNQTRTSSASYAKANPQQVMNQQGSQPLSPSMINALQVHNQTWTSSASCTMINPLQVMNQNGSQPFSTSMINSLQGMNQRGSRPLPPSKSPIALSPSRSPVQNERHQTQLITNTPRRSEGYFHAGTYQVRENPHDPIPSSSPRETYLTSPPQRLTTTSQVMGPPILVPIKPTSRNQTTTSPTEMENIKKTAAFEYNARLLKDTTLVSDSEQRQNMLNIESDLQMINNKSPMPVLTGDSTVTTVHGIHSNMDTLNNVQHKMNLLRNLQNRSNNNSFQATNNGACVDSEVLRNCSQTLFRQHNPGLSLRSAPAAHKMPNGSGSVSNSQYKEHSASSQNQFIQNEESSPDAITKRQISQIMNNKNNQSAVENSSILYSPKHHNATDKLTQYQIPFPSGTTSFHQRNMNIRNPNQVSYATNASIYSNHGAIATLSSNQIPSTSDRMNSNDSSINRKISNEGISEDNNQQVIKCEPNMEPHYNFAGTQNWSNAQNHNIAHQQEQMRHEEFTGQNKNLIQSSSRNLPVNETYLSHSTSDGWKRDQFYNTIPSNHQRLSTSSFQQQIPNSTVNSMSNANVRQNESSENNFQRVANINTNLPVRENQASHRTNDGWKHGQFNTTILSNHQRSSWSSHQQQIQSSAVDGMSNANIRENRSTANYCQRATNTNTNLPVNENHVSPSTSDGWKHGQFNTTMSSKHQHPYHQQTPSSAAYGMSEANVHENRSSENLQRVTSINIHPSAPGQTACTVTPESSQSNRFIAYRPPTNRQPSILSEADLQHIRCRPPGTCFCSRCIPDSERERIPTEAILALNRNNEQTNCDYYGSVASFPNFNKSLPNTYRDNRHSNSTYTADGSHAGPISNETMPGTSSENGIISGAFVGNENITATSTGDKDSDSTLEGSGSIATSSADDESMPDTFIGEGILQNDCDDLAYFLGIYRNSKGLSYASGNGECPPSTSNGSVLPDNSFESSPDGASVSTSNKSQGNSSQHIPDDLLDTDTSLFKDLMGNFYESVNTTGEAIKDDYYISLLKDMEHWYEEETEQLKPEERNS